VLSIVVDYSAAELRATQHRLSVLLLSRERRRIGYRFCLPKSGGCDIDFGVNSFLGE